MVLSVSASYTFINEFNIIVLLFDIFQIIFNIYMKYFVVGHIRHCALWSFISTSSDSDLTQVNAWAIDLYRQLKGIMSKL